MKHFQVEGYHGGVHVEVRSSDFFRAGICLGFLPIPLISSSQVSC